MGRLLRVWIPEKNGSPSPSSHQMPIVPQLYSGSSWFPAICAGTLSGLILRRFCTSGQSLCEVISSMSPQHFDFEKSNLEQGLCTWPLMLWAPDSKGHATSRRLHPKAHIPASGSYTLSVCYMLYSLSLYIGYRHIQFNAECSTVTYSQHAEQL